MHPRRLNLVVIFVFGISCLALAAPAYNNIFYSRVDYASGDMPRDIVTADFDHDRDSDLAVVNFGSIIDDDDSLSIFHNDGHGVFEMAANYIVGSGPRALCVGQFDGPIDFMKDPVESQQWTYADLALISAWSTIVTVMLDDAGAGFHQNSIFWAGAQLSAIGAIDLDGDQAHDLIIGNGISGDFYVEMNNGRGVFTQTDHIVIGDDSREAYGPDIDGDGDNDLMLVASKVYIFINDGNGHLTQNGTCSIPGYLGDACAADFDGDGDLDIAGATSDNQLPIWLNRGDGTFDDAVVFPTSTFPSSIAPSDFDRDGDIDLVMGDYGEHVLVVMANDGQGNFSTEGKYPAPSQGPSDICVGDFDGDNDDDAAAVSYGASLLSIFINRTYNARIAIAPAVIDAADAYGADSMTGTIYIGDFDNGYSVGDIDPFSVRINDTLWPFSIDVTDSVPEIPGQEVRLVFDLNRFVQDYGPLWGIARPYYRVTGQFGDGTPFQAGGAIRINGFKKGDVNRDDIIDIGDPVFLVNYLYREGPAPLLDAIADVNCDGGVDIGDAVFYINHIFKDGPAVSICQGE